MDNAEEKGKGRIDLTEGDVTKGFLKFMVPIIVGNVFTQIYNMADSVIVGQFIGGDALAAVGTSFSLTLMINAFLVSVGTGATVVVSQHFGAKNQAEVSRTINTSLVLAGLVALAITIIGLVTAKPVLTMMNTPDNIFEDALSYYCIIIVGTVGHLYYQMSSAILRGMGDSVWPLGILIFCSSLNIALDLLFVAVFHMGVNGAAWATILAQLLSAVAVLLRLTGKKYHVTVNLHTLKIEKTVAKSVLLIGIPAGLQQFITSAGSTIVQGFTNGFGSNVVAANSTIIKIDGFIVLPLMAISTAITTYVGQNIGAGKMERLKAGTRLSMRLSIAISVVLGVLLVIIAPGAVSIFTTDQNIIRIGSVGLRTLGFFYLFLGISNCLTGVVRGAGASTMPMVSAFVNIALRILFSYLLAVKANDFRGIYYAMIIGNAGNALILLLYYKSGSWKKAAVVHEAAQEADYF